MQVVYSCGHSSRTNEPFWDLSLNFPARYGLADSVTVVWCEGEGVCSVGV